MSWNDAGELVVASNGQVYVAPVGTALPTDEDSNLNNAFVGLGYIDEDGVKFGDSKEITDFMAWQARQAIRREMTSQEQQVEFALQQWNENNVPLAFGGGSVEDTGGGTYRYRFPADGSPLDERAMVIDAIDGSNRLRFVIARGNVTEGVETQFAREQTAKLPITFKALEPLEGGEAVEFYSNGPGFATGS